MKKISLILLASLSFVGVYAQQIPLYSNYYFTPYIYNPAMSGTDGVTELTLLHRRQWTNVTGSPETSALGINGSLNDEKVGWSAHAFRDVTDIVGRFGVYGSYAYKVNLADNARLSLGLGAGYVNTAIDQSGVRTNGENSVITTINNNRGNFDVSAGLNLEIADFSLGFAAPQLLAPTVQFSENSPVNYETIRHYVVSTSYDFKFRGDDNVLTPLMMLKAASGVPIQFDAGLLYNMKKYGYIGAIFRSEYAVTANVGLNLTEQLTLGYAYDFSLNAFGPDLGPSHEFMLTYRFGNNRRNEKLENEIKKLKQSQRSQKDEVEELVNEKLEEFQDEYKRELKKEMEKEAESRKENEASNTNSSNQQQNQNAQNNQNANTNNNAQQQAGNNAQNTNNTAQNNTGDVPGYNASNQASNVQPGSRGYYVVAGVFSSQQNAEKLVRNLGGQGLNARFFQDQNNSYYYVYLLKFDSYQQADQAKSNNLNGSFSGDLWIKIIE